MKAILKPALMLGFAGALALGSVTVSQARGFHHWGGAAAGFAVGAAVGAAAANSYYGPGYYGAYDSYAYAPGYATPAYGYSDYDYGYGYGYDGYDTNNNGPLHERVLEGRDY